MLVLLLLQPWGSLLFGDAFHAANQVFAQEQHSAARQELSAAAEQAESDEQSSEQSTKPALPAEHLPPFNDAQRDQFLTEDLRVGLKTPRVEISLDLLNSEADPTRQQQWTDELQKLLLNSWGEAVPFTLQRVTAQPETPPASAQSTPLEFRQQMELQARWHESGWWEISGHNHEPRSELKQELPLRRLHNASLLPRYLAEGATQLYIPLVQIEDVDEGLVRGTLVGGEFMPGDPALSLLQPGDTLRVLLLYHDREGSLLARQTLDWTYLRVLERERSRVQAEIVSAFRNPVPRTRRRVDILAWRPTPMLPATEMRIVTGQQRQRPLPLTQVWLSPWDAPESSPPTDAENTAEESTEVAQAAEQVPVLERYTDRNGWLRLDRQQLTEHLGPGLIKLEIMSDQAVVARLPWLPGSEEFVHIQVPDDSARVQAGFQLEQVRTRLLRTAAKRATLIAAIRQLAESEREEETGRLFEELRKLPAKEAFFRDITQIRVVAVEALQKLGNRTAARQVGIMCEETRELVIKHLSGEPLDDLFLRFPNLRQQASP